MRTTSSYMEMQSSWTTNGTNGCASLANRRDNAVDERNGTVSLMSGIDGMHPITHVSGWIMWRVAISGMSASGS